MAENGIRITMEARKLYLRQYYCLRQHFWLQKMKIPLWPLLVMIFVFVGRVSNSYQSD